MDSDKTYCRIDSGFGNFAHDGVFRSVDRIILELHDRACTQSLVRLNVARESWKCRDGHDHVEALLVLRGSQNSFHDRGANLVLHGLQRRVSRSGYEELIFNVNEMFGCSDRFNVGVRDRMFQRDAMRLDDQVSESTMINGDRQQYSPTCNRSA